MRESSNDITLHIGYNYKQYAEDCNTACNLRGLLRYAQDDHVVILFPSTFITLEY